MGDKALSGLKIVEYGHLVSAPYCAKILADLGAEVIKVEEPGIGDEARRMEPFLDDVPHPERSGLFLYSNTNKLGITLNLRMATGKKIFKELIENADVFVENNSPQAVKELGIDYESLKEINPRLIMTSITAFGQTGPYRDYKSCELVSFHMSSFAYVNPCLAKDASQEPLKVGGRQAQFYAGLSGAVGTLAALLSRIATGLGQQVDLSELDCLIPILLSPVRYYTYGNQILCRTDAKEIAPFHVMPCKDGYVYVVCIDEPERAWQRFVKLMGNPSWAESDLFSERMSRAKCWDSLQPLILDWTMRYTKEEIYRKAQAAGISFGAVYTTNEVVHSEHLAARGFFVEIEHAQSGKLKYPGGPYKFSETPWQIRSPAPLLGQHNEEIYCQRLGYSKRYLVKLREAGVI